MKIIFEINLFFFCFRIQTLPGDPNPWSTRMVGFILTQSSFQESFKSSALHDRQQASLERFESCFVSCCTAGELSSNVNPELYKVRWLIILIFITLVLAFTVACITVVLQRCCFSLSHSLMQYNYSSGISYETLGPEDLRSILTTVNYYKLLLYSYIENILLYKKYIIKSILYSYIIIIFYLLLYVLFNINAFFLNLFYLLKIN